MKKEEKNKKIRFLKKITILCAIMNIIITVTSLTLCVLNRELSTGTLSVLLGAWSFELTLSAFIKKSNDSEKTENEEKEDSQDTSI